MRNEQRNILNQYRHKIPFLYQIPDVLYFVIDPIGYRLPKGAVAIARRELEGKLNKYVMSYDRTIFKLDIPLEAHLCALLKGARLTKQQQAILAWYEARFQDQGISFVVYEKPLTILDPKESALAKLYKEKGLFV